jgi:Peptidase M66/ToxR activated gene A lipoprotein domain
MKTINHYVLTGVFTLVLTACGASGGGQSSSSSVSSSPVSSKPVSSKVASSNPASSKPVSSVASSSSAPQKPAYWDSALSFTEGLSLNSNVSGNLAGEVKFVQTKAIFPKRAAGEERVLLTTNRDTLLLFTPLNDADITSIGVKVVNNSGQLFNAMLAHPYAIPDTDQNTVDGRPKVVFSKKAWSVAIPWQYVTNNMALTLTDNTGKTANLNAGDIDVAAPIEIVTLNMDLGMLIAPQGTHKWTLTHGNRNARLALDYFQKMPIAKFTSGQYLPVHLTEVVMSNGEYYKTKSAFTGADVYSGDMRESISKGLFSIGINQANVGVPADAPDQDSSTRPSRQTVVQTVRGVYTDANGNPVTVEHGLSGGAGKLTLIDTEGNEFTHEYGHDHGLGHYPGNNKSFFTQEAGWGYDIFRKRFIGSLYWQAPASTAKINVDGTEYTKNAFGGFYTWNTDAMAGGGANGNISVFTQHTAYSSFLIQNNLTAASGVLDKTSNSGYKFWNASTQTMVDKKVATPKPDQIGIPVMTLLGYYDPQMAMNGFNDHVAGGKKFPNDNAFLFPALYANWGNYFTPQTLRNSNTALASNQCELAVTDSNNAVLRFPLLSARVTSNKMNQLHVNLPSANTTYTSAQVKCNGNVLTTLTIAAPSAVLPEAIVVGKEAGMAAAALQLPPFENSYTLGQFADVEDFERNIGLLYGPATEFANATQIVAGNLYQSQGRYFLAKKSGINYAPTVNNDNWYYLGNADAFITKDTLGINQLSIDYATTEFQNQSTSVYYVPADGVHVYESESSYAIREWYAPGSYSTLKVAAVNTATGVTHRMALRGGVTANVNNSLDQYRKLHSGVGKEESGMARIYMVAADNPTLPAGQYRVAFTMYVTGWHRQDFIRAIRVSGTVTK